MGEDRRDDARAEDDDGYDGGAGRVPRSLSDRAVAVPLLRTAAVVAGVMWGIGLVSSMWFQWTQLDGMGSFGGQSSPSRVLGALASGFTATWGYLLVAVTALTAATVLGVPEARGTDRAPE